MYSGCDDREERRKEGRNRLHRERVEVLAALA